MKIINFSKNITRSARIFIKRLFMSAGEKLAADNRHSFSELCSRALQYSANVSLNVKIKQHVIYTCITGGYDQLIQPTYYHEDCDYVCFTDDKTAIETKIIGVWQIRPLVKTEFSDGLNNRWHKTHPHELFPEYEDSIYIDGNIDILSDSLFRQIEGKMPCPLVIPMHFARNCVYKEIRKLRRSKKIQNVQLKAIKKLLVENKFPVNYGLNENNIIYRKHNDEKVIKMMYEWWNLILNVAPRDQLSLPYVLWCHGIKPCDIGIRNARLQPENFSFYFGVHK